MSLPASRRPHGRPLLLVLPVILLFTAAYACLKLEERGALPPSRIGHALLPLLVRLSGAITDVRFRLRGPRPLQQPIVIVAIDSPSLDAHGRWPWHRDVVARLVDAAFAAGARAVGLDMVFSEPDPRLPEDLQRELQRCGAAARAEAHETDPALTRAIAAHADRLVLGWQSEALCQPGLLPFEDCPVTDADYWLAQPAAHAAFALRDVSAAPRLRPQATPLLSAVTVLPNLPPFTAAARHAGYYNAFPDPDGVVRGSYPIVLAAGRPQPSLPLALAVLSRGGRAALRLRDQRLDELRLDAARVPLSPLGRLRVNFLGPGRTFPYVSAARLLAGDAEARRALQGALVLVGLAALGNPDRASQPFDPNVPGVEVHATILENLLSGTAFAPPRGGEAPLVGALMTLGAALLALCLLRLPAVAGISASVGALLLLSFIDVRLLFARGVFLDTGLCYLEYLALLVGTLGTRYVLEERARKFVRATFSRFVSPAVVDQILADPSRLALGGERKRLSVLFSDIRGFTALSERIDPRALVGFLNEYLGRMTGIVFTHGGTLDKYIGDAVMAFWGAPIDQADHAQRALQAALDMVRAVDTMKASLARRFEVNLEIGLGITSGVVTVGNIGSADNVEYTVIGDRVNLASRLESLTKAYGARILTTQETIDDIRAAGGAPPPHQLIDRVRVVGKREAVALVEVLPELPPEEERLVFSRARELFLARRFAEAQEAFAALAQRAPQRSLYALHAGRSQRLAAAPPGPEWDGAWELDKK